MKNLQKFLLLLFITLFASTTVFAQEWTKEQLEVWAAVEGGWNDFKNADIESLSAKYHEKYQGWDNNSPLPNSKEMFFNTLKGLFATGGKVNYFRINPARIVVTNTTAIIDYYAVYQTAVPKNSGGFDTTTVSGKYLFILVKDEEKWLLLGDMSIVDSDID